MATTPASRVTDLARRWAMKIDTATYPSSTYEPLVGQEDLKVLVELRTEEDEMHEDGGALREAITGHGRRFELKLANSTNAAGTSRDPVHAFMYSKFLAGSVGEVADGEFGVIVYDRDGISGEAYEGRVYIKSWNPSGGKGRDMVDVVLQAQGSFVQITNPASSQLPVITSISPTSGDTTGGDQNVSIYGHHFTGVTDVDFGTDAALDFTFVHDGLIIALPPAHSAATVQVKVTNAAGVSANTAADDYTYA